MQEAQFIAIISFWTSLVILIFAVRLFSNYQVDNTRDDIFSVRDEMFLYASDRGLVMSPAYRNLRLLMNGLIRYAHQISFFRLLILIAVNRFLGIKNPGSETLIEWRNSVAALPAEEREKFEMFHAKAVFLIMSHMVFRSPILLIVALCIAFYKISTNGLIRNTIKAMAARVPLYLMEAEAFES